MLSKTNKRFTLSVVALITAVVLTSSLCKTAYAEELPSISAFTGYSQNIGTQALSNATNTYDVINGVMTKNENQVKEGFPQITVLVPGFGSNASVWSNDYEKIKVLNDGTKASLTYNSKSLVEKLRSKYGANVYLAKNTSIYTETGNHFQEDECISKECTLYELPDICKLPDCDAHITENELDKYCNDKNKPVQGLTTVSKITDITKPIVVLFDAKNNAGSNLTVYRELDYVIDKIVYDVKLLNGGVLPKVNLVSHSAGGLAIMQYALEHPDLVDALIPIGSPYLGSKLGTSDTILGFLNMSLHPEKEGFSFGVKDILNQELYTSYRTRWNDGYEQYYDKIKFNPIGSYSSVDFLNKVINDDIFHIDTKIKVLFTYLNIALIHHSAIDDLFVDVSNAVIEAIGNENPGEFEKIVNAIASNLGYDNFGDFLLGRYTFYDDMFIHLDSQLADGYTGAQPHKRKFNGYNTDFNQAAQNDTPIPHNLEPGDKYIHDMILDILGENGTASKSVYTTKSLNDGTVAVTGTTQQLAGPIAIPKIIDGKTVSEIANDAFNGQAVTSVSIPSTVKSIGINAFGNCAELTAVVFDENSTLRSIEKNAFFNCAKLNSVNLPDSTESIGETAFLNSSLGSLVLGKKLFEIGDGAFAFCCKLALSVADGNTHFQQYKTGSLCSKDQTRLLFYSSNSPATFSADNLITYVAPFAFTGNNAITSVKLPNVTSIGDNAFKNCSNLAKIEADNLLFAGTDAFYNTFFLNGNISDVVSIGKTLLSYKGTATEFNLSPYVSVSSFAFINNDNITTVHSGSNLRYIGSGAFINCKSLQTFFIENTGTVILPDINSFDLTTDLTVYVPDSVFDDYSEYANWNNYLSKLQKHFTSVSFDTAGGAAISDGSFVYGNYPVLPTAVKAGYEFTGWTYEENGETINASAADMWLQSDDAITLTANYAPVVYTVTLKINDGTVQEEYVSYTIENAPVILTPARAGYTFQGWFDNAALTGQAVSTVPSSTLSDITLYAKWSAKTYIVQLDPNYTGAAAVFDANITYDSMFVLPSLIRTGYLFNGWYYGNTQYTTSDGGATKLWNIFDNVTLQAVWTRKTYYIRVNANGFVSWLDSDGKPTNSQSAVLFGTELPNGDEIKNAFNPQKVSYKDGHKFAYYTLTNYAEGTVPPRFEFWSGIVPDLGSDGTVIDIYAYFTPEINFSIDFLGYLTEIGINPIVAKFGTNISLLYPAKTGYVFIHWVVADGLENACFANTSLASGCVFDYVKMPDLSVGREEDGTHIYLEAVFQPVKTNITFDTRGAAAIMPIIGVDYDSKPDLPVSQRNGFIFKGWQDADGKTYTDANGKMICSWDKTSNTVLYADREIITYSLTYVLNGGTHTNPLTYTVITALTLNNAGGKTDFRFMGWYTNSNFTDSSRVKEIPAGSTGNKTLYGRWEQLYFLKFYDVGLVETREGIFGEVVAFPNRPDRGYSWSGYEQGCNYQITGNKSFYLTEKTLNSCYNSQTGFYEIWTKNQLNSIRNYCTYTRNYKLMKEIDLENANWTPIPENKGIFDGNEFLVKNLKMEVLSSVNESKFGFFRINSGTIRNFRIYVFSCSYPVKKGSVNISYAANSILIGVICGENKEMGRIENCSISSKYQTQSNVKSEKIGYLGFVAGNNDGGHIIGCRVDRVSAYLYAGILGGIVGSSYQGVIDECFLSDAYLEIFRYFPNYGDIGQVGGIVGSAYYGSVTNNTLQDIRIVYGGEATRNSTLAPEMGKLVGRVYNYLDYQNNIVNFVAIDTTNLNVIKWRHINELFFVEHVWDQAQYAKGNLIGRTAS